ncbi:hypothetical protein NDU88_002919 [Pleurodeles waltl]|uniref:Uncharacterized protein n=1 Tax=Pleurodeles waltl TaxID=8319 RepID=A0AAV7UBX3_PLEWA|nr:hypothetical protein NDU88_002919 [Pleurodeles waltl]
MGGRTKTQGGCREGEKQTHRAMQTKAACSSERKKQERNEVEQCLASEEELLRVPLEAEENASRAIQEFGIPLESEGGLCQKSHRACHDPGGAELTQLRYVIIPHITRLEDFPEFNPLEVRMFMGKLEDHKVTHVYHSLIYKKESFDLLSLTGKLDIVTTLMDEEWVEFTTQAQIVEDGQGGTVSIAQHKMETCCIRYGAALDLRCTEERLFPV